MNLSARETNIQATVLTYLKLKGYVAWRCQAIPVPIRKGNKIVGLRQANPDTIGIPDILLVRPGGKLMAIEMKTKTGKLSPEQEHWRDQLLNVGADWLLARSLDDVIAFGL